LYRKEALDRSSWDSWSPDALLARIGADLGPLAHFQTVVLTYADSEWAKSGEDRGTISANDDFKGGGLTHAVVAVIKPRTLGHTQFPGQSLATHLKAYFFY
jgi:hypothetical protein